MSFTPKSLIVSRCAPARSAGATCNVALEDLYIARQTAVECVMIDEKYLPIFERIEREIEAQEVRMRTIARAQAVLQKPAYLEGEACPIKT